MQKEVWKSLKSYEEYYQVSSYGRVKSLDRVMIYRDGRQIQRKERILSQSINKSLSKIGYYMVTLTVSCKRKTFLVSRLVASTFIPNPDNKPCVNHKDGNPLNNNVYNLEWVTKKENTIHAYSIGLMKRFPIFQIDIKTKKIIKKYSSANEASKALGISKTHIGSAAKGIFKSSGGFIWEYAPL